MLIPDNIHPEQTIYYNGAFVLDVLQKNNGIDLPKLFEKVTNIKKMSFSVFLLCLDWLFLLNLIKLDDKGVVELCS